MGDRAAGVFGILQGNGDDLSQLLGRELGRTSGARQVREDRGDEELQLLIRILRRFSGEQSLLGVDVAISPEGDGVILKLEL